MKKAFIIMFVFVLFGASGFALYIRYRANINKTAASIGIGMDSLTPPPTPAGDIAMQDVKSVIGSASFTLKPSETPGPVKTLVGGLKTQDIIVGKGDEAKKGMTVSVLYTGTLENGSKFDSAQDKTKPFQFVLGSGKVIKGFDAGVVGMRVGGKRKLGIPPTMAYGPQGMDNAIPPNAALYFDVELLAAQPVTKTR